MVFVMFYSSRVVPPTLSERQRHGIAGVVFSPAIRGVCLFQSVMVISVEIFVAISMSALNYVNISDTQVCIL